MGNLKTRKNQTRKRDTTVFMYDEYELKRPSVNNIESTIDAREIGRKMAKEVSKKLTLKLDV